MVTFSANDVEYSYLVETTFGTPVTASAYDRIRLRREDLAGTSDSTESEETDSEGLTIAIIETDTGAAGTIEGELLYSDHDPLIKLALQNESTVATAQATTVTVADAANNKLGSDTFTSAVWQKGQQVRLGVGFAGLDNSYGFIVSVDETASPNELLIAGCDLSAASGTGTVDKLTQIDIGTTLKSGTLVRMYSDTVGANYAGLTCTGMRFAGQIGQIATIGWDFLAKNEVSNTTHPSAISPPQNAIGTNLPMGPISHFVMSNLGDQDVAADVIGFTLQYTRNIRPQNVMRRGTIGMGNGASTVEGTVTKLFETATLANEFLAQTTSDFGICFEDDAAGTNFGNSMGISVPALKWSSARRVGGGKDTDIVLELGFKGFKHGTVTEGKLFSWNSLTSD